MQFPSAVGVCLILGPLVVVVHPSCFILFICFTDVYAGGGGLFVFSESELISGLMDMSVSDSSFSSNTASISQISSQSSIAGGGGVYAVVNSVSGRVRKRACLPLHCENTYKDALPTTFPHEGEAALPHDY